MKWNKKTECLLVNKQQFPTAEFTLFLWWGHSNYHNPDDRFSPEGEPLGVYVGTRYQACDLADECIEFMAGELVDEDVLIFLSLPRLRLSMPSFNHGEPLTEESIKFRLAATQNAALFLGFLETGIWGTWVTNAVLWAFFCFCGVQMALERSFCEQNAFRGLTGASSPT